ncbi:metalloregulator ArsR/SmtB family transcription factor [Breoghania sp.]|uniref:ArsR/SmtB family transcription factor n=1 Tax=Breoghania sp. TaxID=2065378 RepID=UPI002632E4A7|nr:metalloregulator ArsR/SmtB family transcription factor [Breoghania sp.]MDJ0929655.1 metalloregulator ArsR/SmtB family transcription factor [Breoghania sp.]
MPATAIQEPVGSLDMNQMQDKAKQASDYLKALAHENRLLILCILSEGEKSVTELESMLSLRQPAVSQQLARLRAENLVSTRRDGKTIYYSLGDENVRRILSTIYDMFCGSDSTPSEA